MIILAMLASPGTLWAASGGPDAAGYRYIDDAQAGAGAPTYNLHSSADSQAIAFTDDSVSGPHPLPFPIRFYGEEYRAFYASSNGFISFIDPSHAWCCSGRPVPTRSGPQAAIFGIWTDFNPSSAWFRTVDTAEGRVFVYHHEGREIGNAEQLAWQVHLFEGSSTIEVMIVNSAVRQRTWTTGIQNHTANVGLQHFYGSPGNPGPRAVRFYDNALPPVIAFAEGSGSEAPANRQFDALVTVTDPEGAVVPLVLQEGPPRLRLVRQSNSQSRLLWYPTDADVGEHRLLLSADDGTFVGELDVQLDVTSSGNLPPRISLAHNQVQDDQGVFLLNVGLEASWSVNATDPETQSSRVLTLGSAAPAGATIAGGTLVWTPIQEQAGDLEFYLHSEDAGGATSERLLRVRVRRSNAPPAFTSAPPTGAFVGVDVAYSIGVEDPDLEAGDALTLTVPNGPGGAFVDAAGVLHFTPLERERGNTVELTVRVTDLQGLFDEQTIELAVDYSPAAPQARFAAEIAVDPGATILDANPSGRGPFGVAWTLITEVDGASLTPLEGTQATFTGYTAQSYRLRAAVHNGTHYGPDVETVVTVRDLPPNGTWPGGAIVLKSGESSDRLPAFSDPNKEPCSAATFSSQPTGVRQGAIAFTEAGDYVVTAQASCGVLTASVRQVVRVLPEPASGCGCHSIPPVGFLLLLPVLAGVRRRTRALSERSKSRLK
jgi:hypothetical protein